MPHYALDAHDTIASICTPPGNSLCGVIRISGIDAFSVAFAVFESENETENGAECRMPVMRGFLSLKLTAGGTVPLATRCPVVAYFMQSPNSYTGEDTVEFVLSGAGAVLRAALRAVCGVGARHALGGEFTFRAFIGGRIDLGQAESVERMIAASGEVERRAALARLQNEAAVGIRGWREQLRHAIALLETTIDFDEEELDENISSKILSVITNVVCDCESLTDNAVGGMQYDGGVSVVFTGITNAGKSSLINALVGRDEFIVSSEASTTRDRLEIDADFSGIKVSLCDTAGHDPEGVEIGRAAANRSARHVASSTLACLVVDSSETDLTKLSGLLSEAALYNYLLVFNKVDLIAAETYDDTEVCSLVIAGTGREPVNILRVSASTGEGLDELRSAIHAAVIGDMAVSGSGEVSRRESMELREAASHCRVAVDMIRSGVGEEIVADELRRAYEAFARADGAGYAEDILDSIFSRFCVGK